jgi:hypothetical protein
MGKRFSVIARAADGDRYGADIARRSILRPCATGVSLGIEGAPHGFYDPILDRFVQIGMHGQADYLVREPLTDWRAAIGDREAPVMLLPVQRNGVVDGGGDALPLESGRNHVPAALREPDGILRPNRG